MPVSSMLVLGSQTHIIMKETGMDAQATFSCSFAQSNLNPFAEPPHRPRLTAQRLLPQQRQDLGVQAIVGAQQVAELAREHEVSRKFLYHQADTARGALAHAFRGVKGVRGE